jgi:hypothetical protein
MEITGDCSETKFQFLFPERMAEHPLVVKYITTPYRRQGHVLADYTSVRERLEWLAGPDDRLVVVPVQVEIWSK